jgi:hypothetical protein
LSEAKHLWSNPLGGYKIDPASSTSRRMTPRYGF